MLPCVLASVSLLLPPLPDASAFDKGSAAALKEFSATTASNWVIPGRLKVGIGISDSEGCAMVAAPSDPTLKELSAVVADVEPRVRAGDEILYVHGTDGSADLICACLLAQLYQLTADEGLARVSAYAALRDDLPALTDEQKQQCRDLVRIRRASDCAEE